MVLLMNSTKYLIKKTIEILHKLYQKIQAEGILPNTLNKASITLIPKPDKDHTKKRKVQASISHTYRCKIPQPNISKLYPTMYK